MNAADIDYKQMVSALIKPGADIVDSLTPGKADAWHMATGVAGEAGELLDCIFKAGIIDGLDMENVIEELGDLEFYLEGVRQRYGVEREYSSRLRLVSPSLPSLTVALTVAALDLLDVVKKEVIYNKPIDRERLVQTLGEIEVAMLDIRLHLGIERDTVLQANITKLYLGNAKNKARYPDGKFTDAAAQARADKVTA